MLVLRKVGDERHGHAHVDSCTDGDRQDGQEEGPPGGGAGQVEVSLRHRLVGLRGRRQGQRQESR